MTAIGRDLKQDAFRQAVIDFAQRFMTPGANAWGEIFTFTAKTPYGDIPVGLVTLRVTDGIRAEPHVIWFPEASPRNRLELALAFLIWLKKQFRVLLWVRPENWKLYDHLCKYGVLRTVGKFKKGYPDDTDAFLFQGVNS